MGTIINKSVRELVLEEIAENQGDLFEYVAGLNIDFPLFIDGFMKDDRTMRSLDGPSTPYQFYAPKQLLTYYPDNILQDGKGYNKECAWWIGWVYRRFAQTYHLMSKDIVMCLSIATMEIIYPAFHTFVKEEYLMQQLYDIYLRKSSHNL